MGRKFKITTVIATILLASIFLTNQSYAQQLDMSLPEITQKSDRIVRVKAEKTESQWVYSAEGANIITTTQLRVLENIKGNLTNNEMLVIEMPGGTVGDINQYVSSSVLFSTGEESILFLEPGTGYITGGYQGKFPVENQLVQVENQKIAVTKFVSALKSAHENPKSLSTWMEKVRIEPFTEGSTRLKSSSGTNQTGSTNTTYAVSGIKSNFAGGSDPDNDGFFETFSFTIQVNGDVVPGPESVYFRVICNTTGQSWTSVNNYSISGSDVDYKNFSFTQANFAGKINGNMTLDFKVEMLDASKNFLAADESVDGNEIKVDEATAPTLTISSISPDRQSAGTNSEVTITGSGFGSTQGNGKVEFFYRDGKAKIPADILSWSSTQIRCTVPIATIDNYPASAGSGPVTVTNDGGQVSNDFNYRITFSCGGTQWAANSMTYRINENYAGATGEGQAIQNAAASWNAANANFRFEYGGTHTNTTSARNSNNDMMWGTVSSSSIIAAASVWSSGSTILECDIVFNNTFTWNTNPTVPSGTIDVETITLHEMGHWLNLRDLYGSFNDGEYDQQKVMYGLSYYGQRKRDLHPDDVSGIQWIYGMAESVSISGYVRTAAGTAVSGVVMNGLTGNPSTNTTGFYTADVPMGWTGTVTPTKAGYTFTLPSHEYSNQTSSLTDQDFTAIPASNDATLSDLKVSGTTVTGFSKTVLTYNIELPAGTTVVPTVTATTSDANATKVITPASSLPGNTTVRVTAQDGATSITYTVSFTLPAVSSDATLSDLKISGVTVAGFSSSVLTYDVVLPSGTTVVPTVTATTTSSSATKVITPATSIPGTTSIVVTAQDGTTKKTYRVNFTAEKNDDATLSNLKVSNVTVAGFVKTTLTYLVTLPYGTTVVPTVTATASDENATVAITPASSLPGTTTILVTAEDGTTTKTYRINFTLAAPSSDATLAELNVGGNAVEGFSPATLTYAITLAYGTTTVPVVTAVPNNSGATAAITPATSLPGNTRVVVTAEDGTTKKTYTLDFTVAKNSDATLSDLKIDGITVSGFSKNTLTYTVELPYGTTAVPPVTATSTDPAASVAITPATALPGTTRIVVTADDGSSVRLYSVSFTLAQPSSDASLSNLQVNGTTVGGFDPSVLDYTVEVPAGTIIVPAVTATANSYFASVSVQPANTIPGTTTVTVTAQDGTTVRTYSVRFNRVRNNNALLSNLLIEGVQVGGFSPADANYTVELPFGTTTVPVVTAVPEDVNATVAITPAANLPGNTYVRVTAEDGVTNKTYSVSFVLLPASTDATLSDLMVNGTTLTGFNPANQDYTYTLPFGTSTVPVVTAVTSHEGASMLIRAATSVPGMTTVTVTAQDVSVNKTYTINFIPGKSNDASLAELVVDGIPVNGFSKNTLDYSITLPFGTMVIPLVSGTPANANATRSITQAGSLPGTAYVVVVAEDGTTSLTYSVFFNLSAPSSDATLSGLQVDGSAVNGFNPSQLTYQVTLPYGTTRVPEVVATANHNRASIVIMRANTLPGITTVQVTAQDATTRKDYAIQFNVAKNSDATLAAILINGVSLPEFDRVDLSYEYVVPSGTTTAPAISAIPNDPKASAQIILPDAIPGTATIKVTAEDGISTSSYQILVRYPLSGIDEQSVNRSIRVYPNPNKGTFRFEYTAQMQDKVQVSVLDVTGKVLFAREYESNGIQLEEEIRLTTQQKGSYFLRLVNGMTVSWQKIIVE